MTSSHSVQSSQRRPAAALWLIVVWSLAMAIVASVASVPAFRWPWTSTLALTARAPGLLTSDPISPFDTPYLSSAMLGTPTGAAGPLHGDLIIVRGADDLSEVGELAGRTLLKVSAGEFAGTTWKPDSPVQFAPSSAIRLAFVAHRADATAPGPPNLAITIGYDGQKPVVKSIRYWWPSLLITYILGMILSGSRWARIRTAHLSATISRTARTHVALIALLAVAAVVRWALIARGGQYFDWDEVRYAYGAEIFELFSTGNIRSAVKVLLNTPDHPGYRLVALIPAFLQVLSAWRTGHPVSETRWPSGEWLPASVLALASVGTVAMTYALAQRVGASRRESLLAAGLLAASTSMTVYSRHFFPYDTSLFLLLAALWIGLGNPASIRRTFIVGLMSGLSFLIYYGAWSLVAVIGGLLIARRPRGLQAIVLRAACFAAGVVTLPGILLGASTLAGMPLLTNALQFASEANNGDFAEGWSLPWNYLWSIEGGLLLLYATGMLVALVNVFRRRAAPAATGGGTWLCGTALIYGWLVLGANVLHRFTVYDRLARQMLPFVCLAAAAGFTSRRAGSNRLFRNVDIGIAALAAVLFMFNVSPHFRQRYPREFVWEAIDLYGIDNLRLTTTITNSVDATVEAFLPDELRHIREPSQRRYAVVNAKDIWTERQIPRMGPLPSGAVVLAGPHPRTLSGLQFHGYTPAQRRFLATSRLQMLIVDTKAPPQDVK